MQLFCREYTLPPIEKKTRVTEWIRKNTRIGPVLNIKVCCHDDRYSIEVQAPSLFEDKTVSWVRIVNGVDKFVTESMLTKKEEDIASEKPIVKARPRQKPAVTLTSVSVPVLQRKWIDIVTQRSHDHKCHEVSKALTDCYDMINQSLEEATEQSITVTSSKSAGGRSSTVLPNGYLKIGYHFWRKEEERRKGFNTA